MRKLIKLSIILILLFSLFSCKNNNYEKLYSSSDYVSLIEITNKDIKSSLDSDMLYYRFMSLYKTYDYQEAAKNATLYYLLNSNNYDDRLHEALSITLFYSDNTLAKRAGAILKEHYELRKEEKIASFHVLMEEEDYDEATSYYNSIRGTLTAKEATEMLIATKASSVLIVANLEAWYSENGQDKKLVDEVISAISLLNTRGEGSLILSLALSLDRSDEPRLSLALGDLYYSLGYPQKARVYWGEASEAFPTLIEREFTSLPS